MNIKNVQYLSQPMKYFKKLLNFCSSKFWTYPNFVRPKTFGVISKQKKCSIDIDEDEEATGWNRQSVPEISDDDESFN